MRLPRGGRCPGLTPAAPQANAFRQYLIDKYEGWFLAGVSGGILRVVVVSYFCALLLLSLLYVGFVGALWLRGLTRRQTY